MKRFNLRSCCLSALFIVLVIYVSAPPADAGERVLTLTASSGAPMRVLLTGDANGASANLILLAGGDGRVSISATGEITRMAKNFVVRSRGLFASQGFLAAVPAAPSDRKERPGLLGGFRVSEEHAADLGKVAKALKAQNGKPVIAIGTSRGSISAANLAARAEKGTIAAVVLTSSVVKRKNDNPAIQNIPLERITVPVLFVHNRADRCEVTLLSDVKTIIARLEKAGVAANLILVESREIISRPCKAQSPHGFLGIEPDVVARISTWIKARL
jgi:hypothetical protein